VSGGRHAVPVTLQLRNPVRNASRAGRRIGCCLFYMYAQVIQEHTQLLTISRAFLETTISGDAHALSSNYGRASVETNTQRRVLSDSYDRARPAQVRHMMQI
jgi:hypothetical protein